MPARRLSAQRGRDGGDARPWPRPAPVVSARQLRGETGFGETTVGKHARRASVFTDESGRRTRLAATAVRSTTVGVLGIVGAVVVGLLSGVPLPGVTPPVHLPSNEPARAEPPATPSATPARSTDATTPAAASGSPTNAPGAPVTPTPTAAPA